MDPDEMADSSDEDIHLDQNDLIQIEEELENQLKARIDPLQPSDDFGKAGPGEGGDVLLERDKGTLGLQRAESRRSLFNVKLASWFVRLSAIFCMTTGKIILYIWLFFTNCVLVTFIGYGIFYLYVFAIPYAEYFFTTWIGILLLFVFLISIVLTAVNIYTFCVLHKNGCCFMKSLNRDILNVDPEDHADQEDKEAEDTDPSSEEVLGVGDGRDKEITVSKKNNSRDFGYNNMTPREVESVPGVEKKNLDNLYKLERIFLYIENPRSKRVYTDVYI
ncbi:hypothetical protein MAR_006157 [Mya arenaria]|uniref:Uncharacterized protein n=1 Tax=Mya arenaria TaxID=6604 RepID=A0ABY7D9B3_MYAAR|nr:hypothetical protein MAR_006157 [Mya arenaria]